MVARLEFAHNVAGGIPREGDGKNSERIQLELDNIIGNETKRNVKIKKIIKEGDPVEEIMKVIEEEKIDLVMLRAHEEGHIERLLVGGSDDAIIRKMPCSILLVKKEPDTV
jgi:nucleotide-binding universal stress UspA family protein